MPKTQKLHLGAKSEDAAAEYLEKKGYEICARNVRRPWGEIDIVAKRGQTLVFIEVKALKRTNSLKPEDHLSHQKLHRFRRACELYLQEMRLSEQKCRMDAIAIDIGASGETIAIRHIEGIED